MTPFKFPESNVAFGPPADLEESQVLTIHGWRGHAGGSCDGIELVVVAHLPTPEDLARLNAGEPIFISMLGGLAPHFLTTRFVEATNPA
jgi:hypothetical protein